MTNLKITKFPRWPPSSILATILNFIGQICKMILKMDFFYSNNAYIDGSRSYIAIIL